MCRCVARGGGRLPDALWLGRELLGVGDFEDVLADGTYAAPSGWRFPSDAEQLVAGTARDGRLALAVCRSGTARDTASAESSGRVAVAPSATLSLCGCWRGDAGTTGAARVVFWSSLDEDARPLESRPIVEGTPPAEWGCFCRAAASPSRARFASVRLEHTPTAAHTACVDFDRLRLIAWEMQPQLSVTLAPPHRFGYARVTGTGSASSASLSYLSRPLEAP